MSLTLPDIEALVYLAMRGPVSPPERLWLQQMHLWLVEARDNARIAQEQAQAPTEGPGPDTPPDGRPDLQAV